MEYEIGDDPQGLPDRPEADREGGLREDRMIFFRKDRPSANWNRHDDAHDEDSALEQLS